VADNFYDVLGVTSRSTTEEIRSAYRSRAKSLHPDAGGDAGAFRMVAEAYETLSDPSQRRLYDQWLQQQRAGASSYSVGGPGIDDDIAIALLLHQYASMRVAAAENLKRSLVWAAVSLVLCAMSLAGTDVGLGDAVFLWLPALFGVNRSYRLWQHYRAIQTAERELKARVRRGG